MAKSSTPDFSKGVKDDLARRAGNRCVKPGCLVETLFANRDLTDLVNIGEAAHDRGARPGAARHDSDMTDEQRRAYANGAHLCATHARHVDRDQEAFPPGVLASWQKQREKESSENAGRPYRYIESDPRQVNDEVGKFLALCDRQLSSHPGDYPQRIPASLIEGIRMILISCRIDLEFGASHYNSYARDNPYKIYSGVCTSIQYEILETFWLIYDSFSKENADWRYDYGARAYIPSLAKWADQRLELLYEESTNRTMRLFEARCDRFQYEISRLRHYVSYRNIKFL